MVTRRKRDQATGTVAVTRDELLAHCLAKPGAWDDEPWEGDLVAKVGSKIFMFLGAGALAGQPGHGRAQMRRDQRGGR